ncbi:MAG: pseudaminic acid biosynthesis-associated methylase [Verrucomicrobia bacterium]|nr:pseudaminic acid biosynthesis-associated methylase [Verrucomicrobiota bacterium]
MTSITEQELFWQGQFGNEYTDRNRGRKWVAANIAFFSKALEHTSKVSSILELGSNIGLNLMALRQLLPEAALSAVEINEKAAAELKQNVPDVELTQGLILEFVPSKTVDLSFTKGVLIHINPDKLPLAYDALYQSSSRYILLSEYYNPSPTEIVYRGHEGKLFKRDFAGEMLDRYEDLSLVAYGFVYHRDIHFPQDDMTWFHMEKR